MKSQNYGWYTNSSGLWRMAEDSPQYYLPRLTTEVPGAQADYRKNRENGSAGDSPARELPLDGKAQWVKCPNKKDLPRKEDVKYGDQGDGFYRVHYDAGPGDQAWMEEKDRNYLTRLLRERKFSQIEELGGMRLLEKNVLEFNRKLSNEHVADYGEKSGLFTSFASRLEKGRAKLVEHERLVRKYEREHVEKKGAGAGAAEPSETRARREAEEKARHARESQEEQRKARWERLLAHGADVVPSEWDNDFRGVIKKLEIHLETHAEDLKARCALGSCIVGRAGQMKYVPQQQRKLETARKVYEEVLDIDDENDEAGEAVQRITQMLSRLEAGDSPFASPKPSMAATSLAASNASTAAAGAGSSGLLSPSSAGSDTPLSPATPLGDDLPQIRFADLALGEKLGEGGFGIVQKARWLRTEVAVKRLKLGGGLSPEAQAELLAEARLMYRLQHPNIVRFMAVCAEPANPSMILKYMSGGSLYSLLKRTKDLAWAVRLKIAHGAAAGLEFLHSRGIIHRDLKTMNVLLNKDAQKDSKFKAKLTDFGLSRVKSETASSMKMTGGIAGTPAWLAPENVADEPQIGPQSDIYALGTLLWTLVSYEEPHAKAASIFVVMDRIRRGVHEHIPDSTPSSYAAIIQHCWEKDPAKRPSAGDVATQLEALMKTMPNSGSGAGSGAAGARSPASHPASAVAPSYASHPLPHGSGGGAERLGPKPSAEPGGPSYR